MKVVVCVKKALEASARTRLDPTTFRLDRGGAAAQNAFDAHALEEVLRIREGTINGEVVALMIAPQGAADSRRNALALVAECAVHVADESLAGSDLVASICVRAYASER